MKKAILFLSLIMVSLMATAPAYAQEARVDMG